MTAVRLFDDQAPPIVPDVRTAAIQGAGPGHLQDMHARATRTRMAIQEPEAIQRVPARIAHEPTANPQRIPDVMPIDHIDPRQVVGVESAARPAQSFTAGWDGEADAFAPDWTHPTVW